MVGDVVGTVLGRIPLVGIDTPTELLLRVVVEPVPELEIVTGGEEVTDKVPPGADDVSDGEPLGADDKFDDDDVCCVTEVDAEDGSIPEGRLPVELTAGGPEVKDLNEGTGKDTLRPVLLCFVQSTLAAHQHT